MIQFFSILTFAFVAICDSGHAQAMRAAPTGAGSGAYLDISAFPLLSRTNAADTVIGGSNRNVGLETGSGYDLRATVGAVFWSQLLLGFTFNSYKLAISRPATDEEEGEDLVDTRTEFGPTIGYLYRGWRLALTYFVDGRDVVARNMTFGGAQASDQTYTNSDIHGFQALLGYTFSLGGGFELGPALVYRSVDYSTQSLIDKMNPGTSRSDQPAQTEAVQSHLDPLLSLVLRL